jgi:hypothetical protein
VKAVKPADAPFDATPGRASRRVRALAGAGAVLAAAGVLAGCSTRSPATIITPYAAADGVNVAVGDIAYLRDFLVIARDKGGRGAVVGTIVNRTGRTVTVELAAQLGETTQPTQTRVSVPPHGTALVGPEALGGETMVVEDLPVAPGEVIEMSAGSAGAGVTYFKAPVLTPDGQYASLTAPPTTAPPTPTGTPSEESSDAGGDTGVGQSSAEPTDEESPTGTATP